jgi:hypothetical protein
MLALGGCPISQTQTNTAKDVLAKISFYSNMAKTFINIAESYYADNPKVKTALAATKASLATVENLAVAISAGFEKDEGKLLAAAAVLVKNVFDLMSAIKEAKASGSVSK